VEESKLAERPPPIIITLRYVEVGIEITVLDTLLSNGHLKILVVILFLNHYTVYIAVQHNDLIESGEKV